MLLLRVSQLSNMASMIIIYVYAAKVCDEQKQAPTHQKPKGKFVLSQ